MKFILVLCLFLFIAYSVFGNGKVCEIGAHWKEDCNSCWCNDDGTAKACTKMACEPKLTTTVAPKIEKECEPNSTWKKACNNCWCNDDGTAAACTLKGCEEAHLEPVKV